MNQDDIKSMRVALDNMDDYAKMGTSIDPIGAYKVLSAGINMLESLMTENEDKSIILSDYKARLHRMDDQLADCQRELDAERERRFEGNRISSEEQATEIEKYKALCDQMGNALKLFEPFNGEFEALQIKALEAWRALK